MHPMHMGIASRHDKQVMFLLGLGTDARPHHQISTLLRVGGLPSTMGGTSPPCEQSTTAHWSVEHSQGGPQTVMSTARVRPCSGGGVINRPRRRRLVPRQFGSLDATEQGIARKVLLPHERANAARRGRSIFG